MKLLQMILDLIFPPGRDELVMRELTQEVVMKAMDPRRYADATALFPYRHKMIRTLIWQLKYKDDMRAARLLGHALRTHLSLKCAGTFLVVPIPLSHTRTRERGYNQVTRVARATLKGSTHLILLEHILVRTRHHKRQTTLSRLERIRNMRGQFEVKDSRAILGQDVILLDDVITTGATMREAEKALISAGARNVIKIALAH